jgi:predicted PurR-regulated permease PerM
MSAALPTAKWQRSILLLTHTVLIMVTIAALYILKDVFIPLALAIFFSFLLYPLVKGLQRRGIPRKFAVVVVIVGTLLLLFIGGYIVSGQLANLANELPNYSRNIMTKLNTVQAWMGGSERWKQFTEEMSGAVKGSTKPADKTELAPDDKTGDKPTTPVVVKEESSTWVTWLSKYSGSTMTVMAELALALVLAIFILINREDLINRMLRLVGQQRASVTSKAVSETGKRMSRFLLMQFMLNCVFGGLLSVCLLLLGVKYAMLWGFLTAVLRYLPYIGPWISAIFPVGMSLAQFDGWWQPLVVISFYLFLEVTISNFVEPYVYGQSIGVSEVALLIAAAFWAWMWGLVGLVLSAPLTVILVVLGKYIAELSYLAILFSDEPALGRDMSLYQRLLAGDDDEAERMVLARLSEPHPEKLYDEMLIPALSLLKRDLQHRIIAQDEGKDVRQGVQDLVEDLSDSRADTENETLDKAPDHTPIPVLGFAVRDASDHLALQMLAQELDHRKWRLDVMPSDALSSEVMEKIGSKGAEVLVIGSMQPMNTAHLRHLCKKIRTQHREVKLLVGLWGPDKVSEARVEALSAAGADWVGNTLEDASQALAVWYPIWSNQLDRKVA